MTDYTGSNTPADQRDLWRTPPAIFASLDAEFCFQLDAAAASHNALCRKFITAEQNTLETPWADYLNVPGYVWLNPPYSDITPFVKKAATESANQIGTVMLVSADTSVGWFKEAILSARKELLNGWQKTRHGLNHPPKKGRSVPTVNSYMACLGGMLSFAFKSGYLKTDLMAGITPLAKERPIPDPLTSDEYQRVVAACPTLQFQNMVIFAVNTGVRHGELSALSWEDVDTVNWTVTVSRNYSLKGNFTLPKTNAGIRTIQLTQPAIDALKAQMPLTRMMASHKVSVSLREYKKKRTDECTFIFSPSITSMNGKKTMCYVPGSINSAWRTALRRAGVRQRRSYETRNTYACWALVAGANPNFVAHQMGHSSAQMLFTVYGKWMTENNHDQVGILNASFTQNAPLMPHRKTA